MDQCTYEVRLQHWKNIISQCQLRPLPQTLGKNVPALTVDWLDFAFIFL